MVSLTILSMLNPGNELRLTILPFLVLNTNDLDFIKPLNVVYILGLSLLNPSGLLPISSSSFLDLAVTSFSSWLLFLVSFGFDLELIGAAIVSAFWALASLPSMLAFCCS